jgi:two-component system, NarL family, response regulator LiaR
MSEMKPIRVLIVDDHAMVRCGLRNFLYAYDWIETVGEASNGAKAVEFCANHPVDIVLMDMVMEGMNGDVATQQIMALGKPIKIIVLTNFTDQDRLERALKAGATSYLTKNVTADELAQAIRAAQVGRATISPEVTEVLMGVARQKPGTGSDLTDRELQVLSLLVKGHSNAEIASRLNVTVATVKFHLINIFSKLGVKSRVEAVTLSLDHKLIDREAISSFNHI